MRPVDIRHLVRFQTRMGMFICPSNRENVVSYLNGYEDGVGGECRFIERLSHHIDRRYQVRKDSLGWPGQIERLAGKYSLDWMEVFHLVSPEVLGVAIRAEIRSSRWRESLAEPHIMARVAVEATFANLADLWAVKQGLKSMDEVRAFTTTDALIDTEAMLPSLPTSTINQLGLTQSSTRRVPSATGPVEVPMYEAVRLTIMGRECTMDVLEVTDGSPVTIGRIPLTYLDLVIDSHTRTLIGNPDHNGEHVLEM